ncbi:MAG: hypothetical protein AAF641_12565 [Pseudomonadota bacterium]
MTTRRLMNYVAFAVLMVTTFIGIQSLWGALFLYWAYDSIKTGNAFLLSPIGRSEDAMLFWLVMLAWEGFGIWLIVADFYAPLYA